MPEHSSYTIKTYRYLRLAMVTLLVLIAAAVVIEHAHTHPRCFQPSISDYYYTPAQAIFVSALVTIGVCMIALKGSTEWEDILLNLGGMLAPVVALVPTPQDATCSSVSEVAPDIPANVANNIAALFVAGLVGLVLVVLIALLDRRKGASTWDVRHTIGMLVAAAVLLVGFGWFLWGRSSFIGNAHYGAAFPLFGCIVAVAVINARGFAQKRTGTTDPKHVYRNRYFVIAVLMVVLPVLEWLWWLLVGWDHVVLGVEATLLVLFASFWVLQTHELWSEGVRDVAVPPSS